jgi:hypothetical protein
VPAAPIPALDAFSSGGIIMSMKTRDLLSADLEQLLTGVSGAFPWWRPVRPQPISSVGGR